MAQPTKLKTPLPCDDLVLFAKEWSGPNYKQICTDTIPALNKPGFQKCCYWIVYYDRVDSTYEWDNKVTPRVRYLKIDYEVNVTSVIYDGMDCHKRTNGEIVHAFENIIMKQKALEFPDYFTKHGYPETPNTNFSQEFYSTGGCYEKNSDGTVKKDIFGYPIQCDSTIQFCCSYTKQIYLSNGIVTTVDSIFNGVNTIYDVYDSTGNNCNSPCQKGCDEVLLIPYVELNCFAPCDQGLWVPKPPMIVTIPGCPNCMIRVTYSNRVTSPCAEIGLNNFMDLRLDRIEADSASCSNCVLPMKTIHSLVIDELIKTGFAGYPSNGFSSPYYRVFYSSCWSDFYSEGCCPDSNGVFNWPSERVIKPCIGDLCCIRKYTISTDSYGQRTYILNEIIIPQSIECPINIYPCVFICGDDE